MNHEKLENVLFSDHALCIVNTLIASDPVKSTNKDKLYSTDIPLYNLMKAEDSDWDKLNDEISSLDWNSVLSSNDMKIMTNGMISNIEAAVKKSMKLLDNSKPSGFSSKNIIPKDIRKLFKRKCKLTKELHSVTSIKRCTNIRNNILSIDIQLKKHHEVRKQKIEEKLFQKSKSNKNHMYKHIKKAQKSNSKIGPFIKDGKLIEDKACNVLRKQYEKVFSSPSHKYLVTEPSTFFTPEIKCMDCDNEFTHICPLDVEKDDQVWNLHDLNMITINPDIIRSIMTKLDGTMACGPDGIPALLLKKCANSLAGPLAKFWQASLDLGEDPSRLKGALIFPNLKDGGKRTEPASWRPISHTSQISLIFERYLKDIIVNHLEKYQLIGDHQFGFRKHRSCMAQLLRFYDQVLKHIEDGSNCDIIYLDFAKAFDKVDFGLLCHRLRERRIWGQLGTWIHSFLSDRWQKVVANGEVSEASKLISGVPQGSVLGPLLFLLIIDSLGDLGLDAIITSFADDSKLSYRIDSIEDALYLQECLDKLQHWQLDNNMEFNVGKFNVLKLGRKHELKSEYNYLAPGNEHIITDNSVVRDLGVLVNSDGTYSDHIAKIYSKISQRAGLLLRTLENRSLDHMRFIWRTYLEPLLDYSSQLYSPYSGGGLIRLESLLESFSSKVQGLGGFNYWDRLNKMKILSVSRRFERYKLLYCMKILNRETQNCGLSWTYSQDSGYIFEIPKFGKYFTQERKQSFNFAGPSLFNTLPLYLRKEIMDSKSWKILLDKFLEQIPDNPITLKITSGLCEVHTSKPTNSLTKWIPHLGLLGRRKHLSPD